MKAENRASSGRRIWSTQQRRSRSILLLGRHRESCRLTHAPLKATLRRPRRPPMQSIQVRSPAPTVTFGIVRSFFDVCHEHRSAFHGISPAFHQRENSFTQTSNPTSNPVLPRSMGLRWQTRSPQETRPRRGHRAERRFWLVLDQTEGFGLHSGWKEIKMGWNTWNLLSRARPGGVERAFTAASPSQGGR